jgi:hypothetical protein
MEKTITLILTVLLLQNVYCQENQIIKEGTRQIHLDFHTSGIIENIGTDFSKEQFKEALKVGNVNSIWTDSGLIFCKPIPTTAKQTRQP